MSRILGRTALALVTATAVAIPVAASAREDVPRPLGTAVVQRVKMVDNRFRPSSITIARGTVVKWINRGNNTHTTTSSDDLWNSGRLAPGDSFRRRFRRAGTFTYVCTVHLTMRGTITVT